MRTVIVPEKWIDPASLNGEAFTRWYLRSPTDVERERQEAAALRYQDFFYGGHGEGPDPEFVRNMPVPSQGLDSQFAIPSSITAQNVEPGSAQVPASANRWQSAR